MRIRLTRGSRGLFAALLVLTLIVPALTVGAAPSAAPARRAGTAAEALNWQLVHQAPAGQFFYTITFPTRNVGYAISGPDWNNASNGAGAPTVISKTTDGGKTWKSTAIPNTDGWMRGLTCSDANNCWIAGRINGKRVMRTTDGGATWTSWTNQSGYPNWLWSAGWTGKGTTVLAGTTCYDPADTGATANWVRSTDGQIFKGVIGQPGVYNCQVQWDIECPAAGYCYSVGKDFVWRSTNDGANWTRLSTGGAARWYGGSCTSTSNCWISGKTPFLKSTTNNGGAWSQATVSGMGSTGIFWDLAMLDNQHGYAVGCDNLSTDNTDRCLGKGVIHRTDDGATWTQIAAPTTAAIMDLWVFGMGDIYILDWTGKIWHGSQEPMATPTSTATPTATATATATATSTPDTGVISGFVFSDANDDAFRDMGEPGLANAIMVLRRGSQEVATATSDGSGLFRFTGVAPGQYTLRQKNAPSGYQRSLFLSAFEVTVNREFTFYVSQPPGPANTATPTATATATTTGTSEPTATPTSTSTVTATSTPTATRATALGYLPLLLH